jgi:hypothetical protein
MFVPKLLVAPEIYLVFSKVLINKIAIESMVKSPGLFKRKTSLGWLK